VLGKAAGQYFRGRSYEVNGNLGGRFLWSLVVSFYTMMYSTMKLDCVVSLLSSLEGRHNIRKVLCILSLYLYFIALSFS